MTGSCLCGAVRVEIDAKPEYIHDCDCSLCRRSGAAWGYFTLETASATGDTVAYLRQDKEGASVEVHSCKRCAVTTHWTFSQAFKTRNPTADSFGVNMKLFDPRELNGVEVRFPNGRDWPGCGPFAYRRPAMTISESLPW